MYAAHSCQRHLQMGDQMILIVGSRNSLECVCCICLVERLCSCHVRRTHVQSLCAQLKVVYHMAGNLSHHKVLLSACFLG